jgi:leader peptidase (prepilin peptidase) / N-methyltransferase
MAFLYALCSGMGLIIGSFLNVCIYRVPAGLSIVSPGSSCPGCNTPIRPWHNIPVISYLLLGGRCASCGMRISPRYPLVETLNALAYVFTLHQIGPSARAVVVMALMSAFIVIAFIDLDHRIIPNGITIPGMAAGLVLGPLVMGTGVLGSVLGLVAGGGLLYGVMVFGRVVLKKEGMGGGDVKLMAMVGSFIGWKLVLLSIFIGSFAGSIVGVPLIALKVIDRDTMIPFGPFLVAGSVFSIFYGTSLIGWYGGFYYL